MVIGCGHAAKGCAKTRHVSCGTTAPLLALSRSSIDNDALTGSHGHHHGLPPGAQRVAGSWPSLKQFPLREDLRTTGFILPANCHRMEPTPRKVSSKAPTGNYTPRRSYMAQLHGHAM